MKQVCLFFAFFFSGFFVFAQDGTNDSSFNTIDSGVVGYSSGASSTVRKAVVQPDNKIIIVGSFLSYNGINSNRIARLNQDGTLDPTFNVGLGADNVINDVILLNNNKIIIVGNFTQYNGNNINRIARLNADGTFDSSYNVGTGFNAAINTILKLANDDIVVGGTFTSFNSVVKNRIAKLHNDGTLDTAFTTGVGFDAGVLTITADANNKLLVGGSFASYNSVTANKLLRLNADGTADSSFNIGIGPLNPGNTPTISALLVLPDGKLMVGGYFSEFDNYTSDALIKLNSDGSIDYTFDCGATFSIDLLDKISSLNYSSDNKLLVTRSSQFPFSDNNFVKLNLDGSVDTTFILGATTAINVQSTVVLQNSKILVLGNFSSYGSYVKKGIVRISSNGILDETFNSGGYGAMTGIRATAFQQDGKIIIGGTFTRYNMVNQNRIVRLNEDGSIDNTFNVGSGFNSDVRSILLQGNGKIIVMGAFTTYNGVPANRIVRLNSDGSIDNTFITGSGFNNEVERSILLNNGKILMAGRFTRYNNSVSNNLVLLNPDGTKDISFNSGLGIPSGYDIFNLKELSNGNIMITGNFVKYNGFNCNYVAQLSPNGSLNSGFDIGSGFDNVTEGLFVQADDKIIIGGGFSQYKGVTANQLIRLNPDGSIDTSFNSGSGVAASYYGGYIWTVNSANDGRIYISGDFLDYNGTSSKRLCRLNNDGSFDNSFSVGTGFDNTVTLVDLLPNNKILASGFFTSYNGIARNSIARLTSSTLGTVANTKAGITVYPNPVKDRLNIDLGDIFGEKKLTLFDVNGKTVKTYITDQNFLSFDFDLQQGIYFLKVQNDQEVTTIKIIK